MKIASDDACSMWQGSRTVTAPQILTRTRLISSLATPTRACSLRVSEKLCPVRSNTLLCLVECHGAVSDLLCEEIFYDIFFLEEPVSKRNACRPTLWPD